MSNVLVVRTALAALAALVLVACSDGPVDHARAAKSSSVATPAATPSVAPYDPGPWAPLSGSLGRCGPQPPRLASQAFDGTTLRDRRTTLPAITAGRGRTVVVLLHQTDGNGLCGWLSFAQRVAAVPGQMAVAFDLCGYGDARCAEGSTTVERQVEQVRLAIDAAEHRLHARRIVVVGASMGGSLAVLTAAGDRRIDAVVDLSGPDQWRGAVVHRSAARLRAPVLVSVADDEGPDEVAAGRATAEAGPAGSEFAEASSGHGYVLLEEQDGRPTELSERALAWIRGI